MAQELRPKLALVQGITAYPVNPPVIPIGGRMAKSLYQYTLQGPNTDELYARSSALMDKMTQLPGLQDVTSDMQLKNLEINVTIDRDKAASLNVSANQIETALADAYGSQQISTIYAPTNEYQVIMELLPQYQLDPESLSMLYVQSSTGAMVPLSAVSSIASGIGPMTINHSGQLPSVTISFNTKPGVSLGEAVNQIKTLTAGFPATISTSFQGTAQAFQDSMQGMLLLLTLAVLVIYMVLGILYENFWHPITILSALPFAGFGALLTLLIFNTDLSLYAYVGIIMLVGLVKKNGIMMVDFAIESQRRGNSPAEAIHEACLIRFRPIMMTTMCALMAGLPIALGWGAGAESRRPLGLAVVGGLLFSQTLTLYVTPVFYTLMEDWQNFLRRLFGRPQPAEGEMLEIETGESGA